MRQDNSLEDRYFVHICMKLYIQTGETDNCSECKGYGLNVAANQILISDVNSNSYAERKKILSKFINFNKGALGISYCNICGGELPSHQDFCVVKI